MIHLLPNVTVDHGRFANEEGAEATAATGIAVGATSFVVPEEPAVFRAHHPFVFLIRDNRTESILFLGRLVYPQG